MTDPFGNAQYNHRRSYMIRTGMAGEDQGVLRHCFAEAFAEQVQNALKHQIEKFGRMYGCESEYTPRFAAMQEYEDMNCGSRKQLDRYLTGSDAPYESRLLSSERPKQALIVARDLLPQLQGAMLAADACLKREITVAVYHSRVEHCIRAALETPLMRADAMQEDHKYHCLKTLFCSLPAVMKASVDAYAKSPVNPADLMPKQDERGR